MTTSFHQVCGILLLLMVSENIGDLRRSLQTQFGKITTAAWSAPTIRMGILKAPTPRSESQYSGCLRGKRYPLDLE